jgi:hypothetical protein
VGSTFDNWLREEGIFEEVTVAAVKRNVEREDLERINAAIDEVGPEAEDIRRYQSLDDPPNIE